MLLDLPVLLVGEYAISVILATFVGCLFASSQLIFYMKNVGCLSLRFHFVVCLLNLLLLTVLRNVVCRLFSFGILSHNSGFTSLDLGWTQYYVVWVKYLLLSFRRILVILCNI
jgi:hypothetical protein